MARTILLCGLLLALGVPALAPSNAAEPPRAWQLIRSLPAAEAHQAAAADDEFAYAITNDKVVKYERKTGKFVARSTVASSAGKLVVKHLNSGFFHEGKLYCAHSNYPRLPEQSEIMVLDPATMEIAVFHDFGNFGGSLTWAIFHDGNWWCNFALYGPANDQTFLVRFDKDWKPLARWTYPPDVIKQIGLASISGGVWHDDTLLVTDHDHGTLYRLKLPTEGKVLQLVGQEKAPFTGQGIAADPVTGGLVGIDRAKKQLLFAELK